MQTLWMRVAYFVSGNAALLWHRGTKTLRSNLPRFICWQSLHINNPVKKTKKNINT